MARRQDSPAVSPWLRTRLIQPNFLTGKAHRTYIHAEQQYSR